MNILMALGVLLLTVASCNSAPEKKEAAGKAAITTTTTITATASGSPTIKEIIDPVCGMVKDSTWTEYTVYKGDTVWFCAESERIAFEGNPKKYEAALNKKQSLD